MAAMEVLSWADRRRLDERNLIDLLRAACAAAVDGLVVMRCRQGLRHGFWLQGGYVVGAHLAGHFDPLLELLRRAGAISADAHARCVRSLAEPGARAGVLAMRMGVPRERVRDVLRAQLVSRAAALLQLAEEDGHDGWFEPRAVTEGDASVRMPLGSLLRALGRQSDDPQRARRKQLRQLARALHPDRHAQLDPEAQRSVHEALARATAAYHGFA